MLNYIVESHKNNINETIRSNEKVFFEPCVKIAFLDQKGLKGVYMWYNRVDFHIYFGEISTCGKNLLPFKTSGADCGRFNQCNYVLFGLGKNRTMCLSFEFYNFFGVLDMMYWLCILYTYGLALIMTLNDLIGNPCIYVHACLC
jgi:hypothetical protein